MTRERKRLPELNAAPARENGEEDSARRSRAESRPVGAEQLRQAVETLREYKRSRESLEQRILENEKWFRLRNWDRSGLKSRNGSDPEPVSAWLFNTVLNKHADAMDSFPKPTVLPRERGDEEDAALLSAILPVIREQSDYEQVWSDLWWQKLKYGTAVTGVFWDSSALKGAGDIRIRRVNLLSLYFEPGVDDIQKSRNLFCVELADNDVIRERYPGAKTGSVPAEFETPDGEGSRDTAGRSAVVDWYYKRMRGGREVLHYCKFLYGAEEPLYASENDPLYRERGYYDHGQYPFVTDALFPVEGSPAGFGYVDVCKSPQMYIDKLDQVFLKRAIMGARPRFFIRGDGRINEEEFADWSRDFVHYNGSGSPESDISPIGIPGLDGSYAALRAAKIDELKETAGNRDFQQGGTSRGVTAASAIEALQESGNKLSRDMIRGAYRADAKVSALCVELMRQFYTEPRYFRVAGRDGGMKYLRFCGRQIGAKPGEGIFPGDGGSRVPVFDIRIQAEKASPFSQDAQNERAKELFRLGFFRPDMAAQALAALEMMQFEGVEALRERIAENAAV